MVVATGSSYGVQHSVPSSAGTAKEVGTMGTKPAGRRRWAIAALGVVVVMGGPALAGHMASWSHRHNNYPPKPHGLAQIKDVFGAPCSDRAFANSFRWQAADNGVSYRVNYHRKLGGAVSSNLDYDVRGHIAKQHLGRYVKSGIWGYNCRFVGGTRSYSTHAWGIAVDVSASFEPQGQCHSTTNWRHAGIWRDHRWTWGKSWCDPMHFQYATGY